MKNQQTSYYARKSDQQTETSKRSHTMPHHTIYVAANKTSSSTTKTNNEKHPMHTHPRADANHETVREEERPGRLRFLTRSSGDRWLGNSGSVVWMASSVSSNLLPPNGKAPVTIAYKHTPADHVSTPLASYLWVVRCEMRHGRRRRCQACRLVRWC